MRKVLVVLILISTLEVKVIHAAGADYRKKVSQFFSKTGGQSRNIAYESVDKEQKYFSVAFPPINNRVLAEQLSGCAHILQVQVADKPGLKDDIFGIKGQDSK